MIEQEWLERLLEACLVLESVRPSELHCPLAEPELPELPELPEQEPEWEPGAAAPASSFFLESVYPSVLRWEPPEVLVPAPVVVLRWQLEHRCWVW